MMIINCYSNLFILQRVSTALDTIFSPVFHIFKGDAVNSYPCNGIAVVFIHYSSYFPLD